MNKKQLIENAKKLGYRCEEHGDKVGFNKPRFHVWHWFDCKNENDVEFNHSYSMNTGSTKRGLRQRLKLQERFGFYNDIKQ